MMADSVLLARDIQVVRNRRIILEVGEVAVRPGEVLAVIGPNGAGKSTLLSVLACLDWPTRGHVLYRGTPVTRRNVLGVRRDMAVVFQEPLLLDGTVLDNVALGLRLRGKKDGAAETATEWLKRFSIDKVAGQTPHTLSGGEAQRTSLARAFALEPQVLFMDEPFAAVDVISRQGLIREFTDAQKAARTTTVLVTHDFREVAQLADRVIVLHQGLIQTEGAPAEIARHEKWGILAGNSPVSI